MTGADGGLAEPGAPPAGLRGLPKLVATDLDGTLVRSDYTVSDRSRAALSRVKAASIPLVGVTGRGPRLIDMCRADLGVADYLVLAQGAYVAELSDPPTVLHTVRMDGTQVLAALARIEAAAGPVEITVEALDAPGSALWSEPGFVWPFAEKSELRSRDESLAGPVYKVFVRSTTVAVEELFELVRHAVPGTLCEVTYSGLGMIELCPPDVTKASGLSVVAAALGVDPGDVLVFGDMPNDVSMFEWAGYGVAVGNAHDEVLAVADDVTGSSDEDGVARYLEQLLDRGHL